MATSLEDVVAAVLTALNLDAHTPHAERHQAQSFLDAFQDDSASLSCVPDLVQKSNPDPVRHFGLGVFQHNIKYCWGSFDQSQKDSLKKMALDLIVEATKPITEEEKYIKEKLCDCVVEIVKQEWPQGWGELFDLLSNLVQNDTQAELVLLVFRSISDVIDEAKFFNRRRRQHAQLTPARAAQIEQGYANSLQDVFPFLTIVLKERLGTLTQLYEEQGDDVTSSQEFVAHGLVLTASLQAVTSLFGWAPVHMCMDNELVDLVTSLLLIHLFRQKACDAVAMLLSRKRHSANYQPLVALYDHVPRFFETLQSDPPPDDHLRVLLVTNLVDMGVVQLAHHRHTSEGLHENFMTYATNMLEVGTSSSLRMRLLVMPVWIELMRAKLVTKEEAPDSPIVHALLQMVVTLMSHGPWTEDEWQGDYDCQEDVDTAVKDLKVLTTHLMRSLTALNPRGTFAFLSDYLAHVLEGLSGALAEGSGGDEVVNGMQCVAILMQACIAGIPRKYLTHGLHRTKTSRSSLAPQSSQASTESSALIELIEGALRAAIEIELPVTFTRAHLHLVGILNAFAPYLQYHHQQLHDVFGVAFDLITYSPNADMAPGGLADDALEVRSAATKAVAAIVQSSGEHLVPICSQVWDRLVSLDEGQLLRATERTICYKVVLVIASMSRNPTLQGRLLEAMLAPALPAWTSEEFASVIASADSLMHALGLMTDNEEAPFSADLLDVRIQIFRVTTGMSAIVSYAANWSGAPLAEHFEGILFPLLTLVRTLHEVSVPPEHAEVPVMGRFRRMLDFPERPEEALVAAANSLTSLDCPVATQLRQLQAWIACLHRACYGAIGELMLRMTDNFFAIPDLLSVLTDSVLAHLATLPLRHLRPLLKRVVGPLRDSCPKEQRSALVSSFIVPWLEFMSARLGEEWSRSFARQQQGPSGMADKEEVLQDAQLRQVTIEYTRFLRDLAFRIPRAGAEGAGGITGPSTWEALLSDEFISVLIHALSELLGWPHRKAAPHCLAICQRVARLGSHMERCREQLGRLLFPALISFLTMCEHEGNASIALVVVGKLYVDLTPHYPQLTREYLTSIPGVEQDAVQTAENELAQRNTSGGRQQEIFRELLGHVVGAGVARVLYKRDTTLVDEIEEEVEEAQEAEEDDENKGGW